MELSGAFFIDVDFLGEGLVHETAELRASIRVGGVAIANEEIAMASFPGCGTFRTEPVMYWVRDSRLRKVMPMTLPGDDLDTLLETSKPDSYEYDAALRMQVRAISFAAEAEATRESSRRRAWWRRPRVVIGAFGVLLLGTTGGAMASQFNFADYLIGGKVIPPDVEVPIYYETATGKTVHCTIGLVYGHVDPDVDVTELKSFVANHDWSGIGQRVYEQAMRNPFTPGPNDDFPPDVSQSILDSFSFNSAMGGVIDGEIPPELMPEGTTGNMPSNCSGKLR